MMSRPPGAPGDSHTPSFEPVSGDGWRDPFPMYQALRDHDPVHHVDRGDYWVLSRFADVFDAVRDTATFTSTQGLTFNYNELHMAGLDEISPMVFLDPPDHTTFRRLVSRGFAPRQVQELEPDIRRFVVERLEGLEVTGGGDVVAELLKPLPSFVVATYLGVHPRTAPASTAGPRASSPPMPSAIRPWPPIPWASCSPSSPISLNDAATTPVTTSSPNWCNSAKKTG